MFASFIIHPKGQPIATQTKPGANPEVQRGEQSAAAAACAGGDPANPARAGILRAPAPGLLWSLVPNRSENPQLRRCCCCSSHWVIMILAVYRLPIETQVRARSSGVFLEKLCFLHHMPGKPWLYCLRHRPHQLQETRGNHVLLVSDANGKS